MTYTPLEVRVLFILHSLFRLSLDMYSCYTRNIACIQWNVLHVCGELKPCPLGGGYL